jgi:hypothetical protein
MFSTGSPDGKMATAARIPTPSIGIETADDFILTLPTRINHATFVGLIPLGAHATEINIDLYHVFPADSVDPPSGSVPTRVNSPADTEFTGRNSAAGDLTFSQTILSGSFTAANSVVNGIHPKPNETTFGEGPVTGVESFFDVIFTIPLDLPPDHYFFVPTVTLDDGTFLWLSAPKPIVAPGTPFLPDLQSWIRNENLEPDWLRVGTDIVGNGPFNATFSLDGFTVPEPSPWLPLAAGGGLLAALRRRRA